MHTDRYQQGLLISVHDFTTSGWQDAIAQSQREGYQAMWRALSTAEHEAFEQGEFKQGKVLRLLADVCSMMLSPSSPNEPFKPIIDLQDKRSAIPDDLHDSDVSFLAQIADSIDNAWLRARLCDIVSLKSKPLKVEFALKAIDAYCCLPLDRSTWDCGARDCWPRALGLARALNTGAGDRLERMEQTIVESLFATNIQDGLLGAHLADLLDRCKLGRKHKPSIATKLELLAKDAFASNNFQSAFELFSGATRWYQSIPDSAKSIEMTVAAAECWLKEGDSRVESERPSHLAASRFFEKAIQIFRTIPRKERSAHQVDERISVLYARLEASGQKSLEELKCIQTKSFDISQLIDRSRKMIAGRSLESALVAFSNISGWIDSQANRNGAIERMRAHPLLSLHPSTLLSRDGRVIARRPAFSAGTELTANDELAIRAEMVSSYRIHVDMNVRGAIWPGFEVLQSEHRLHERDFVALARNAPFIPDDRAGLFGKGLFAGYDRDFTTALHLLIPQIEHFVRMHLKHVGAKTTNIDKDGIENEIGLSSLMELPQSTTAFGEDLAFELRSLFCDPFGPNLRNELAHGLLDEDMCNSSYSVYAWWLSLRLTLLPWWMPSPQRPSSEESNRDRPSTDG